MSKNFFIPNEKANDRDSTGKLCIAVSINGKRYTVLTGEIVQIPYEVYCVLRDVGIINEKYSLDEVPDPLQMYV